MAPEEYARRAVALYIKAEGTPKRPRSTDWDTARDLCNRGVELRFLEHAIRIATLRRAAGGTAEPIHSLAYFRTVVLTMNQDKVEQGYFDYVKQKTLQKDHEKSAAKQPISSASS